MGVLKAVGRRLGRMVRSGQRPSLQLGYVLPVSEDVHNAMRKLQLRILRQYGWTVPIEGRPHITLKQGFPVEGPEPFERHFDRLVSEVDPFEVEVRGVDFFDEGIVFLGVVESSALRALRLRILRDLVADFGVKPGPLEDERYRFHATVAHGIPAESLARARTDLHDERVEFGFECDSLQLLLHTGQEWITYKHARLARSARG